MSDTNPSGGGGAIDRFRARLREKGLIAGKADWVPYQGPQRGKGWKNVDTGAVDYGEDPPGDALDAEAIAGGEADLSNIDDPSDAMSIAESMGFGDAFREDLNEELELPDGASEEDAAEALRDNPDALGAALESAAASAEPSGDDGGGGSGGGALNAGDVVDAMESGLPPEDAADEMGLGPNDTDAIEEELTGLAPGSEEEYRDYLQRMADSLDETGTDGEKMTNPVEKAEGFIGAQRDNDTRRPDDGGGTPGAVERFHTRLTERGIAEKQWVPYQGPQGGSGWKNLDSGEVDYSDEPPGPSMDEEELREEAAAELVEMNGVSEDGMRAFAEDHDIEVGEDDSELEVAQAIADEAPPNVLANTLGGQDPTQVAETVHGPGVSTNDVGDVYETAQNAGADEGEIVDALEAVARDNGLDPDNDMEVGMWLNSNPDARQEALERAVPEPDGGGDDGDGAEG